MTRALKTAIAASLMGIGTISGVVFYNYSTIEGIAEYATTKNETSRTSVLVNAADVERPDIKRIAEMAKNGEKTETKAEQTTTVVSTKRVSEITTLSETEEQTTQTEPQEVTTIEWYVSDPNGFAIPVDAYGETLGYYPDCEPAGIILPKQVEETTIEEITTYSNETTQKNLPEYGSDEYLLAYAMSREAADFTDAYYVGNVILNRRDDPEFPNSILEILQQPLQYDWGVTSYERKYIYDERFYEIARELLAGKRFLPKNVVYQAQFEQGSGTYMQYGVHYYCVK